MSETSSLHTNNPPHPNDPLFKVKLLAALRSGDPSTIVPLISDINKSTRASLDSTDAGAAALHLAIRCASCDTILLLLQQRPISPNAVDPPGSGTTALHLAASIGRADVVTLLLQEEEIDDTIRDSRGKTCLDVAKTKDVARIIKESRNVLNANYLSLLRGYIMSSANGPPPEALIKTLQSPRIRNVDMNQMDMTSGTTLLHEAVKRKDLSLIELAVRAGADVFVRDRRGRGVTEMAGKDDRTKAYLRQFTNQDTSLLETNTVQIEEPTMRGYLTKYGNLAKGYNTRWFVLKDGMLSYYRHQDDENLACRGSLSMRNARVKTSPTDKLRFEIHASTRSGEGTPDKWYMKANHAVEVSRWVQAIQKSIEWNRKGKGADPDAASIRSTGTDPGTVRTSSSGKKRFGKAASVLSGIKRPRVSRPDSPIPNQQEETVREDEAYASDEEHSWTAPTSQDTPPYQDAFDLTGNTISTHIDLALQILGSGPSASRTEESQVTLTASLSQAQSMLAEYMKMVHDRETWYKAKVSRERERATIWEDSLQKVVQQGEELEEELRKTIRQNKDQKRRSKMFEADTDATVRQKSPRATMFTNSVEQTSGTSLSPVAERSPVIVSTGVPASPRSAVTSAGSPPPTAIILARRMSTTSLDSDSDEFFDAIEANALPNMHIPEVLQTHLVETTGGPWLDPEAFAGYQHLRERLNLDADNRPPVSLWAVLKGCIGQDLSRISFPVFFNEPTSMLQRMAEDMEFSECLDVAAKDPDPFLRIAYVAAFAISNYSSTISRLAKPFNPCLSETFEYARIDKQFRYVSEKVIHQPPVTACMAQSPNWQYYGEVDAKNKFSGKSFEIRPTGVAHADLKLPKDWAPHYPEVIDDPTKVTEHYSWRKVTTNVSGFILGAPTIDHYGEMIITNHRTKDKCILTFKPRGWKARDSSEIKGQVFNARGEPQYDIAGRWSSQLIARRTGDHTGDLLPDVTVSSTTRSHEYILLWRNSEKTPAPFNLTPFAITLNDCPETLKKYLPPTDCRLRPDQRAFEEGQYERANVLKMEQEEFQRATRRRRENGEIPPHKPRWFEAKIEPDSGERYWAPLMKGNQLEYWYQRDKVAKAIKAGVPTEWEGVDKIYIDSEF